MTRLDWAAVSKAMRWPSLRAANTTSECRAPRRAASTRSGSRVRSGSSIRTGASCLGTSPPPSAYLDAGIPPCPSTATYDQDQVADLVPIEGVEIVAEPVVGKSPQPVYLAWICALREA